MQLAGGKASGSKKTCVLAGVGISIYEPLTHPLCGCTRGDFYVFNQL